MKDFVARVDSTLKGGCSADLGPKTVIVGPNGSGKSTILQAMELALTGQVSDVEGRESVRQTTALGRLFPAGDCLVTVGMNSGDVFQWKMEAAPKGGFKKPVTSRPFVVRWPLQELKRTLAGDTSTVAQWIESQVGGELSEEDFYRLLPNDVRNTVKELVTTHASLDMLGLAKKAKTSARSLRSQATRVEKTIDGLVGDAPLGTTAREELEAQAARLSALGNGVSQAEYDAKKEALHTLYDARVALLDKIQGKTVDFKESALLLARVRSIRAIQDTHVSSFGEDAACMVCGVGDKDALQSRRAGLWRVAESLGESANTLHEVEEARRLAAEIQRKATELAALTVRDEEDYERAVGAMHTLAQDDAARRAWTNAQGARAEVKALRKRAALLTEAGTELEKAGTTLVSSREASFSSKVNSFLPESSRFGLDLKIGRLGFTRSGALHSALSGAEWTQLLLSVASATDDGSTPSILVPDDRAWDGVTLASVMNALSGAPGQVILMSTVFPTTYVPGWTVVDLTDEGD